MEAALLMDLGFIVLAGTFFALIFKKLKQPLIVGYILAGLVVGPIGLGLIKDALNINALAQLGVAFLLFALGMEIDFSKIWQFKRTILIGGIAQIVANTAIVAGLVHYLGFGWIEAIYAGFIAAFSSTVIVVKILTDRKQINSLEGKLIIGYALVQDLAAVLILPILANPNAIVQPALLGEIAVSLVALLGLGVILNRFVFPRLMKYAASSPEVFYLTILSSFFLFTAGSYLLNFSLAAGAFIGGLALSQTSFSLEARSIIRYVRDFFATVFFVSLGMQLTLLPLDTNIVIFIAMLGVVFILNPVIFTLVNLWEGFGLRASVFIGLALAQASEFSFILASQGYMLGQLSEPLYNIAIWTILISMIATPYMINRSSSIHEWLRKSWFKKNILFFERKIVELEKLPSPQELEGHVIIAGAGVFGNAVAQELQNHSRLKVVVVEQDPQIVSNLIQQGFFAVFASRHNTEVWEKTRLEKAKLLIVTIPDTAASVNLTKKAKQLNPNITVFCRCHYYRDALELYKSGADLVIMPQVIASNFALQEIQQFLDTGKKPKPAAFEEEYFLVLKEKAKEETQITT